VQPHGHFIAGDWVATTSAKANVNPSDLDDVVGEYCQAGAAEVRAAMEAARQAAPAWANVTPQRRFEALDYVGTEILARKEELGRLLAREEGKVLADAIAEVTRAGHIFKFFAGEAIRIPGEKLSSVRPDVDVEITREPIGVVGIITPWNFPIAIPSWKIAPALAYGNCVVFKPADLVPGSAWALAEIISRSGLPAGVFNLIMGPGSIVGDALLSDPALDALTFTGSVETGRMVAAKAAGRMIKVQLEMGGKNPLVILEDAALEVAVECAINGAFFSTGQRCTASSRLIAADGIHDRLIDAMVARLKALSVDHALKPGTDIGPVADDKQFRKDQDHVATARGEGANLVWGGETLERATRGYFLNPALLTETDNRMRINREEVFGPVASVIRVRDYEEALAIANDTPFGLSAGICTSSLKYATHFKRNAQAGMVMVNLPTAGVDYHVPFGGRKGSSYGPREQGRYAVEFFTTVKTAYTLS
jgi:aldehyde dehydrogenase (NAD+)